MKIKCAEIKNYRMLKCLNVDLEDNLSLIIGKNNTGKTSFLSILKIFLSDKNPSFSFEDFNIDSQEEILQLEKTKYNRDSYKPISISLKLTILYEDSEDIADASILIMDLDSTNNHLIILFEYSLSFDNYERLIADFEKSKENKIPRTFEQHVSKYVNRYFSTKIMAVEHNDKNNTKIITFENIKSIISFDTIGAKRDVNNEQGKNKSLSTLAGKYYSSYVVSEAEFPKLQKTLVETDEELSKIYEELFKPIIDEISTMSYDPTEAELKIISNLSEKRIFEDNTIVKYKHVDTLLPEDYNGLGYLNLFAMLFNIRIKLDYMSKKTNPLEKPTPINILFIEEPEAHTHPQMQYVFITNIKKILAAQLEESKNKFSLQTIISTHSSNIISQCDFDDIKYFYRETNKSVKSRSLNRLHSMMVKSSSSKDKKSKERSFRFVKQYITLNRAELFFADKAILIEGDTERILIKAMMKKIDEEMVSVEGIDYKPLLSQKISVIEVGAHSYNFAIFLGFIGIKTLIITDIDYIKKELGHFVKCEFKDANATSNYSIINFTKLKNLSDILKLNINPILFDYDYCANEWKLNSNGTLRLLFQKEENGYYARTFEDAFISINMDFIVTNKDYFTCLKHKEKLETTTTNYYDIATSCIASKTAFALDLLLYDGEGSRWKIPLYLKEGLLWIAK